MRKSKYIHEKQLGSRLFVLNLLTFKYLILDELNAELWKNDMLMEGEIYNTLISEFFLVEDDNKLFNFAIKMLTNTGNRNPNHIIYITDECNQRCTYCFEKSIDILGKRNKVLTYDQIDKIISNISEIDSFDKKKGTITVFGGEPLLQKNKKMIEYLIESCMKNNTQKIDIVTNGITLGSYIDTFNKYSSQIRTLIITLNGYREMHDIVRGSVSKPTFEVITKNIKYFLKNTANIKIRINILLNKLNISQINSLLIYLKEEEITTDKRVDLAFGRIQFRAMPEDNGYIYELPYEEYYSSIINNYYDNKLINDGMIEGSEVSIIAKLYKFWKNDELAYPELKGCAAVYPGRLCYFVDGNIYPCTEVAGIEKYKIGNYMENGIDNYKYQSWYTYKVKDLEKCKECKFIGLCNGACPVSNITMNGEIEKVYCLNMEKSLDNFIQSLYIKGFFYEDN